MGKTDLTGIAILAAVGFVGYGLLKSDFFKGVGEVGTGIGTAVGGTGAAISDIAGDVGQVTGNIADFTNPLGQLGTQVGLNMEQSGTQNRALKGDVFDASREDLTNIQAQQAINKAEQKSLRSEDWQGTLTEVQDNVTDWVSSGSSILTYNPLQTISNWVKSQVKSIREPKVSMTGNVVSTGNGGVTSSNSTSSLRNSSLNTSPSSSNIQFMEKLGYYGQSTESGVKWTKAPVSTPLGTFTPQTSIRKPVKKSFWDKITFWN